MMEQYKQLSRPPQWALKQIQAGRLKGKTDINPQWRYEAMTNQFGMCGIGWKYEIEKLWTEPGPDNQVFAFAEILLYVKSDSEWSHPIPGIGGHMLVPKEKSGLHANDEAFKMAITDALSTAMKMLGVAADIYAGRWDGSKYIDTPTSENGYISQQQAEELFGIIDSKKVDVSAFLQYMKAESVDKILAVDFAKAKTALQKAKGNGGANAGN